MMTFEEFNALLLGSSGVSVRQLREFWQNATAEDEGSKKTAVNSLFFKQYRSSLHTLGRGINIVSDPVVLGYLAVAEILFAVYKLFEAIWHAINADKEKAVKSLELSATAFLVMISAVLVAVISPVVNLIDLIGGGVATLACEREDDVLAAP